MSEEHESPVRNWEDSHNEAVAQLVEHCVEGASVTGSNPVGPTNFDKWKQLINIVKTSYKG